MIANFKNHFLANTLCSTNCRIARLDHRKSTLPGAQGGTILSMGVVPLSYLESKLIPEVRLRVLWRLIRKGRQFTSGMSLLLGYDTVTAGIPVKFGTAHGRSRPDVGSGFRIEAYGSRVVIRPSLICGTSD